MQPDLATSASIPTTDTRLSRSRQDAVLPFDEGLRSAFDDTLDAVVVCDTEGRIVRASEAAARLCGVDPLLQPFDQVFVLEWTEHGQEVASARLPTTEDLTVLAVCGVPMHPATASMRRRSDGERFELLVSARTLREADGRLVGCDISMVDITDSRRTERALRKSEARLRSILESSPDAAYRRDLRTHEFDYLSPSIEAVTGFSAQELSRMPREECHARVHPDDFPKLRAAWHDALHTGEFRAEYRFMDKDGHYRWLADCARVIPDSRGSPRFRCGAVRDVSDRKSVEDALRRANLELAEADRRKNEFLAVLSHELRNPLAPIRNSLHVLRRTVPNCEKAQRALAIVDRQASQLARLVDDLLDMTRIERNKVQLQREVLEINELVQRTVEDHRSLFEKAQVRVACHACAEPLFVDGDRNRLAQVFGNLLQNAAKYTAQGGSAAVAICADQRIPRAVIRVSDTGVGIARPMLPRLFEPYSQADSSLDRSRGGLGLGLALVKGLVELHGGEVAVHSEGLGRGSEFVVRLPLLSEATLTTPSRCHRQEAGRRRVLVIEDNIDAAESLREVLELAQHQVEVAYNGVDGIAKARLFRPEVVLCDIGMPGMDGYDVARALRADDTLRATSLVALTGYALPEDLRRAEEAGFERHLAKPPNLDRLEELLRTTRAEW